MSVNQHFHLLENEPNLVYLGIICSYPREDKSKKNNCILTGKFNEKKSYQEQLSEIEFIEGTHLNVSPRGNNSGILYAVLFSPRLNLFIRGLCEHFHVHSCKHIFTLFKNLFHYWANLDQFWHKTSCVDGDLILYKERFNDIV